MSSGSTQHNLYAWTSRIFIFCARKIQKSMQIDIDPLLERCRHSADSAWDESDGAPLDRACGVV